MNKRMDILTSLVSFSLPLNKISDDLSQLGWDYEGEPLIMAFSDIENVLRKYMSGCISAQDLEHWANLIECREDIDFEKTQKIELEHVIYSLANPLLEGVITVEKCKHFISIFIK